MSKVTKLKRSGVDFDVLSKQLDDLEKLFIKRWVLCQAAFCDREDFSPQVIHELLPNCNGKNIAEVLNDLKNRNVFIKLAKVAGRAAPEGCSFVGFDTRLIHHIPIHGTHVSFPEEDQDGYVLSSACEIDGEVFDLEFMGLKETGLKNWGIK